MFKFMVSLSLILITNTASADTFTDLPAAVGAEVILRQVAVGKFLGADAVKAIQSALKGSGTSSLKVKIEAPTCYITQSGYTCDFWLTALDLSRPEKFQDVSFGVEAKIQWGKVISANPYCTRQDPTNPCEE